MDLSAKPCILLALVLAGCKPSAPTPATRNYTVHGIVRAVTADARHATIQHDAIPGYMGAMTMDFTTRNPDALKDVTAGDEISFTLAVTATNDWIENVQRLGHTNGSGLSGPPGWHVAEPELNVGDVLPDYEFTDDSGRAVRFSDFRGHPLAFTFFFTSCPLPEYCPRMNRNLAEVRTRLLTATNAPADWELLSISFDPGFDTPQLLSSYAQLYRGTNAAHWRFVVASSNTLASLAPQVDLNIWHEGGSISHNLRTVVLDAHGRIFRQLDSNGWTPEELANALIEAGRQDRQAGGPAR